MADRYWGSNSSAFLTGFGGTVNAGDSCFITESSRAMTSGLNQGSLDILKMFAAPSTAIGIGAEGAPLEIQSNQTGTGLIEYRGVGPHFYLSAGGTSNVIHRIIHKPANGRTFFSLTNCDNEYLNLMGARFELGSTADLANVYIGGGAQGTLRAASGVGDPDLVEIVHGVLRSEREIDDAFVGMHGLLEFIEDGLTIPLLRMHGGRTIIRGGTITAMKLSGGAILDLREAWGGITLGSATDGSIEIDDTVKILLPPSGAGAVTVADDVPVLKGGRESVLLAA